MPGKHENSLKKCENFPLLLGKLMISLTSWRFAGSYYYARCSVVGETQWDSTDPYLAAG